MVYKDCNIGSAKPSGYILKKYPHKMVDVITPNEIFTVADFCEISIKIIKNAHKKKKLPLFVGGSMMYFKSLMNGIHNLPNRDEDYRKELEALKSINKKNFLYELLIKKDPIYAKKINKNDELRIIRALEVHKIKGLPMSKIIAEEKTNGVCKNYDLYQLGIVPEREFLHKRIKSRLDKIIDKGLIKETEGLLKKYNINIHHPIRSSVNYKQAFNFIDNQYDIDTFYEKALFATRQLAKRQITWLRSWENFENVKINKLEKLENDIKKLSSLL